MYKLVGGILVMVLCLSSPTFAQQEIQEAEEARLLLKDKILRRLAEQRALPLELQSKPRFKLKQNVEGNTSIVMAIGTDSYDLSSHEGIEELQRRSMESAREYCEKISQQRSLTSEQQAKLLLAARVQIARDMRKLRAMTRQSANLAEIVKAANFALQIVRGTAQNEHDSLVKKVLAAITPDFEPNQ